MTDKNSDYCYKAEDSKPWLYLLHHMHHCKENCAHKIHHCFAIGENGEEFEIEHLIFEDRLYHIILGNPANIVKDHLGNQFKVVKQNIDGQEVNVLTGLVENQEIKPDI